MRLRYLGCLLLLGMMVSTATATTTAPLTWAYQTTGFPVGSSGSGVQTALAMRDGETWPVIFNSFDSGPINVNAFSLYPVTNYQTGTYWHQIGTGILPCYTSPAILSAATSPDGRFGAVLRAMTTSPPDPSVAIVGSSASGFGSTLSGVRAIDFNAQGNLVAATNSTIPWGTPGMPSSGMLLDISTSPLGDLGALVYTGSSSPLMYCQSSPLLGGWASTQLPIISLPMSGGDMVLDSLGRPHVVAFGNGLAACDFNIQDGTWKVQTLGIAGYMPAFGATLAADGKGGVGAAWVEPNITTSGCSLKYAYKNGDDDWAVYPVTSSVGGNLVDQSQRVGLAFDADDFPVISFVAGGNIWLAYDPPAEIPEPSTLILLAAGGAFALAARRRLGR